MQETILVYINEKGETVGRGQISATIYVVNDSAAIAFRHLLEFTNSTGCCINIQPGSYRLDVPIALTSKTRIQGSGRTTRLIVTNENQYGYAIIASNVCDVQLIDIAIQPESSGKGLAGVILDRAGNCTLSRLFVAEFGNYGIWMRNACYLCTIEGCSAAANQKANYFNQELARDGPTGDYVPNLVTNCFAYGGGIGFESERTVVLNYVGCTAHQCHGAGFRIHKSSNSVLLSGCRTFQITGHALLVDNSHELNVTGNIFCWHTLQGIVIRKCCWGTITGNEVIDSGSANPNASNHTIKFSDTPTLPPNLDGMRLECSSGYSIVANSIFNWYVCPLLQNGIYEDKDCHTNTVIGNTVNYYKAEATKLLGQSSISGHNHGVGPNCLVNGKPFDMNYHLQSFQTDKLSVFVAKQNSPLQNS